MRREPNRLLTVGILLLITLGIITLGNQSGLTRLISGTLMWPLAPLSGAVSDGVDAAAGLVTPPEDYATLEHRARELEKTVAGLQIEIVRLREIERDYYRLSGLLNYSSDHPEQTIVTADVVARDTSSYLRWVIINKGSRDGIHEGNPVISDLGLVGRIESVAANAAWIRLAIDPNSTVSALLQNARAEGVVSGQLTGGLRMTLIPQEAKIEVGDLVLTSGLGGVFPSALVIGQVSNVQQQPAALFQEAEVRPTVDFDNLKIVMVITAFQPVNTSIFNDVIAKNSQP
jgi:rod shape-determining protein MreC